MSIVTKAVKKVRTVVQTTFRVKRALGFVWESSRGWTVAHVCLLAIQGVLPIVSLVLLRMLVDTVVETVATAGQSDAMPTGLFTVLIAVGVVTLLTGLTRIVGTVVSKEQARRVADHMHDVIQAKAIAVELEYYENAAYHDSLHRAQEEAMFRPGVIVSALSSILQNGISLVGVAWLLLTFQWPVLVILVVALIPSLIVRLVFSEREFLRERSYTEKERSAWYFNWMLVGKESAKEIRVFGLGQTFIRRFRDIRAELRKIRLALDVKGAWYSAFAHISSTVLVFGAYFWVAFSAIAGRVTVGGFVMFYQAFQRGQGFLQGALDGIARLYENNLFLTNLYEFLDIPERPAVVYGLPEKPRPCALIEYENVWFTYPGTSTPILKGVDFTIESGKIAALVGLNGAGKTTVVKLLCRLYEPDQGRILLDGVDIRAIAPADLRRRIGVIFQDYVQYHLTARDNIWFGDVEQSPDTDSIVSAAERAGIDQKIRTFSGEYDTVLGRLFANGHELSTGQWQKLALARAFFRDTGIVVLDEPTSAMDPKSEFELFDGFRRILNDRTALLISHRMSTVRMADTIHAMVDGQIVESGTHDELMRANGVYAHLFEMQARNYREDRVV
ncbi:MAG: ABC transporter ATP-binding protein [Spirochaetaceae bacterium]|nr:MAG: ABC transporter ATP-binding protein [Spirochaetaceae bacterium]